VAAEVDARGFFGGAGLSSDDAEYASSSSFLHRCAVSVRSREVRDGANLALALDLEDDADFAAAFLVGTRSTSSSSSSSLELQENHFSTCHYFMQRGRT
jgi:2-phospho-L-lactate guanylyltransferase (CobY/MobA/RfbA family)